MSDWKVFKVHKTYYKFQDKLHVQYKIKKYKVKVQGMMKNILKFCMIQNQTILIINNTFQDKMFCIVKPILLLPT